jgi:hypothetical protein
VRNRESRLLVTAHSPIRRFPSLWMTQRAVDDDDYVLRQLLLGCDDDSEQSTEITEIDEAMIRWREVRLRHPTDMREALMEMYDWWEKKKRPATFDSCRPF